MTSHLSEHDLTPAADCQWLVTTLQVTPEVAEPEPGPARPQLTQLSAHRHLITEWRHMSSDLSALGYVEKNMVLSGFIDSINN